MGVLCVLIGSLWIGCVRSVHEYVASRACPWRLCAVDGDEASEFDLVFLPLFEQGPRGFSVFNGDDVLM